MWMAWFSYGPAILLAYIHGCCLARMAAWNLYAFTQVLEEFCTENKYSFTAEISSRLHPKSNGVFVDCKKFILTDESRREYILDVYDEFSLPSAVGEDERKWPIFAVCGKSKKFLENRAEAKNFLAKKFPDFHAVMRSSEVGKQLSLVNHFININVPYIKDSIKILKRGFTSDGGVLEGQALVVFKERLLEEYTYVINQLQ
jgi:hypothetical protein